MPATVNIVGPISPSTGCLTVIDLEHEELHYGHRFTCGYSQLVSDTGDKSIVSFRTCSACVYNHLHFFGNASTPSKFYILEAPTITDNAGATLAVYNSNRTSTITSTVWDTSQNPDVQGQATYFTEATMDQVSSGTKIVEQWLASGVKFGSGGSVQEEIILQLDTLYAFVIESLTDDDNYQSIFLSWSEHHTH